MKWTRSELLHGDQTVFFDEDVDLDDSVFASNSGINGVADVHADGSGSLDAGGDMFICDLHVEGVMICPDSITGEARKSIPSSRPMKTAYVSLRTKSSIYFRLSLMTSCWKFRYR